MNTFAASLLDWYREHGRHDLPWKRKPDLYRTWVSEIMLQQTRVSTVIPYYECFIERFPDVAALAQARLDAVLPLWAGLGYYARARNLHRAAGIVCEKFAGALPTTPEALMSLPGIGRSTAGAILALARNQPQSMLDGNVKRILCRYYGIRGWPGAKAVENKLWEIAAGLVPARRAAEYTQAIMDLGATICLRTQAQCPACPLKINCAASRHDLQDVLPERKPKKVLPQREAVFVILENRHGEILLERRPPVGIWGGLWSLPECAAGQELAAWVRQNYGLKARRRPAPAAFRHTFSHFHLHIQPVRLKTDETGGAAMQVQEGKERCWRAPQEAVALGVAAPIKRLILACAKAK